MKSINNNSPSEISFEAFMAEMMYCYFEDVPTAIEKFVLPILLIYFLKNDWLHR
jgi:hypothetical protein